MNWYMIANFVSGKHVGCYRANSKADALDAMARAKGYRDYDHATENAPAEPGELVVRLDDDGGIYGDPNCNGEDVAPTDL